MTLQKAARRALKIVGAFTTLCLCVMANFILAPDRIVYGKEIRRGNELVSRIESFRQKHGRLPASSDELRISGPDAFQIFYEKCTETKYIVWFGTTVGESMTYSSEIRTWNSGNNGCSK